MDKHFDELKLDYKRHLLNSGIPKRLINRSLTQLGKSGNEFAEILMDSDTLRNYFSNTPFINLYGSGSEDLLYSISRGLLLLNKVGVVAKPLVIISSLQQGLPEEHNDRDFLGVPNFYNQSYDECPFIGADLYKFECFLDDSIQNGCWVIVNSDTPISKLLWYSDSMRRLFAKYGRDVQVDAGN